MRSKLHLTDWVLLIAIVAVTNLAMQLLPPHLIAHAKSDPTEAPPLQMSFEQMRKLEGIRAVGEIGAAYTQRINLVDANSDGDRVSVFLDKVAGRNPWAHIKD